MYVRLFSSAIDPNALTEVRRIFAEDIGPVFESFAGCLSLELLLGTDRTAGGLVDAAALYSAAASIAQKKSGGFWV